MKFNFKRLATVGLLCAGLVACGSDDDDDTNGAGTSGSGTSGLDTELGGTTDTGGAPGDGDAAGTSAPAPGTTPGELFSAFDGDWVSNCAQELSVLGATEFQRITLAVTGDTFTRVINSYTDSDCTVASVPAVATSEHSMKFPDGEVTTTQGPAQFVDITLETIEVDGIDASILQQVVGFDTEFNIYVVGDDGRLYFGLPALSADDRPTSLSTSLFFEAQ